MPEAGNKPQEELKNRYRIAIAIVVSLALGSLALEKIAHWDAETAAELSRVAAEQKLLVQHSESLILAARLQDSAFDRSEEVAELKSVRTKLMHNHELLMAQGEQDSNEARLPEALQAAFYQAPLSGDRRLRTHVARIDAALAEQYPEQRSAENLAEAVPPEFIAALDEVSRLYAQNLAHKLSHQSLLSYSILIFNLIALATVAVVVVRPVMQRLKREHDQLSDANVALKREVSERQRLAVQHAAAEAKFRNAFENAPIGMGLMDVEGYVFDANPALQELFHHEEHGLVFDISLIFLDDDQDVFKSQLGKLVRTGEPVSRRLRCCDRSGKEIVAVISLSPVLGPDNEIQYVVLQVQDITESHTLNSKLEYQASYDELTGLMNRRAFNREVEVAWDDAGNNKNLSFLLFMDLDQFKVINDTSGHAAGDQLLCRVSEIIKDCVRSDDLVCRLGGDEFGVVLKHCPADIAKRIAETIRADIDSLRFAWGKETYRVGVSIGVVALDPSLGDVNEIQQLADAACYAAKEAGRNCVEIVAEGRSDARRHRRQIRWVQRLRDAMENNRFAIYGQQIKPTHSTPDAPDRVEVLLRLRDPDEKRLIPPGAFLPAAERYGLNVELDEWVVSRLLDMLFVHHSFQARDVRYWVNLSGNSIGDERFAAKLKDIVRHSPLPPGTINFEVTETAVIRNVTAAGRLMSELQEMGCEIALDDFGSGLSSFGYLKHLPINYLKIDGMFIKEIDKDPTNRIFVKSIIDIAHSLDIETVAEFVENREIEKIVTDLGIDYLQGFNVERPFVLAPKFPERSPGNGLAKLAG